MTQPGKQPTQACPLCGQPLTEHDDSNPAKAGCWHCNACGSCWNPELTAQREGHLGPHVVLSKGV